MAERPMGGATVAIPARTIDAAKRGRDSCWRRPCGEERRTGGVTLAAAYIYHGSFKALRISRDEGVSVSQRRETGQGLSRQVFNGSEKTMAGDATRMACPRGGGKNATAS